MGFATIENRLWHACPTVQGLTPSERVLTCEDCEQFSFRCCQHPDTACHHFRVFFADGACLNNGFPRSRAGVGIAIGMDEDDQFSLAFSEIEGEETARTSQIAELRAAIETVKVISAFYEANKPEHPIRLPGKHRKLMKDNNDVSNECIIAMDSEYVVNGMTDWIYKWRENGMVNARGFRPANLDLFLSLDRVITEFEEKGLATISFWHIPREYNKIADRLAKEAAQRDGMVL
ncbi:hypothetical protein TWF730_001105 [Orbilia blumenaviensis]|uniref:ribonuclease H n=1 Tax=Orbilia blumenaviensis TaxID=1796055 RepID=A0AAV9VR92_9PEZI